MGNFTGIGREVGDCEIKSISFQGTDVFIKLFDPNDFTFIIILFSGTKMLFFHTNNVQNVIDSIRIYDSAKYCDFSEIDSHFHHIISELRDADAKLGYLRPIAGGETLIVFESFELQN